MIDISASVSLCVRMLQVGLLQQAVVKTIVSVDGGKQLSAVTAAALCGQSPLGRDAALTGPGLLLQKLMQHPRVFLGQDGAGGVQQCASGFEQRKRDLQQAQLGVRQFTDVDGQKLSLRAGKN